MNNRSKNNRNQADGWQTHLKKNSSTCFSSGEKAGRQKSPKSTFIYNKLAVEANKNLNVRCYGCYPLHQLLLFYDCHWSKTDDLESDISLPRGELCDHELCLSACCFFSQLRISVYLCRQMAESATWSLFKKKKNLSSHKVPVQQAFLRHIYSIAHGERCCHAAGSVYSQLSQKEKKNDKGIVELYY